LSVSLIFILAHGTEYVAWPRLLPPTDVLLYIGPGYRARYKGNEISVPVFDEKKASWMLQGRKFAGHRPHDAEKGKKRVD
jgi:phosphatidylinositol 4-phosphatase